MKKVVASLFLLFSFVMIYAAEPDSTALASEITNPIDRSNCTCKGIPLYGNVMIVTEAADFDVRIVNEWPDLYVQIVEEFPSSCGLWRFVDEYPDFTIRLVDSFPDFDIQYVNSFPGVR